MSHRRPHPGMMGRMSQEQPTDPTRLVPEGFVFPGTEMLDPHEVFAGPGYQAPQQRTDPVAAIVLVLTLLSPFPGFGATAAIMGWWALRRLRRSYAGGHGQAWLGVIVGSALVRPMLDAGRDGIPAMRAIAESLAAAAHDTSSRSAT